MPSPETSRRNLEKAKANWRPPLPWRSLQETRLIKALAWRWYRMKEPRCGGRQIARHLGVSHTYIQKLVREFETDTRNIVQQQRDYGQATFAELRRAQEETAQLRERGWLRQSSRQFHGNTVPPPREQGISSDPLVAVKYSSMLVAEESRKVRPIPFSWRHGRRRQFSLK